MNNFTKEELQIILDDLNNEINLSELIDFHNDPVLIYHYNLRDKLKRMIDTYCEHEWVNGVYCRKCEKSPSDFSVD